MKGAVLGTMAVCGVGGATYYGVGTGPNDYVGTINQAPDSVYATFASAMGPEGITALPSHDGWPARLQQRVTKTPGQEVRIELIMDNQEFASMEIEFAAEGPAATRIAAEIDLNAAALASLADAGPGDTMAFMAMGEGLIDMAFAETMAEMVQDVEKGQPLTSFAMITRSWGDSNARLQSRRNRPDDYRPQTIRPDASARPMVDPNAAARSHRNGGSGTSSDGWGAN